MPDYEVQMSWKVNGSYRITAKNKKEAIAVAKSYGAPRIDAELEDTLRVDNVINIEEV